MPERDVCSRSERDGRTSCLKPKIPPIGTACSERCLRQTPINSFRPCTPSPSRYSKSSTRSALRSNMSTSSRTAWPRGRDPRLAGAKSQSRSGRGVARRRAHLVRQALNQDHADPLELGRERQMTLKSPLVVRVQRPGMSLGLAMREARTWLDNHKIQPAGFRCDSSTPDGAAFEITFSQEHQARLFEQTFT